MSIGAMLRNPNIPITEIGQYLDALTDAERRRAARALFPWELGRLYDRARDAEPISLAHFVPDDRADGEPVIHHGLNSFPVFRRFQKRFARPAGGGRLFGYNEGVTRPFLGPGYFVTHPTADRPEWASRGAVVIDYFLVPDGPVPPGWPRVVPNGHGLQRFVYHHTRDFMRRVSTHVSIGRAFKDEKALPAYFVLCREP